MFSTALCLVRHASWTGYLALILIPGLISCVRMPEVAQSHASGVDEWHEFTGLWTASGTRNTMHLGGDRRASISTFAGTILLKGSSRPGVGFGSEAIIFSDSVTGMLGRAVWTNERGDRVFSELRGEGTATNNKIVGTFVGGTGPYAGARGSYEFSWRFILENEEGTVQGQSADLVGRISVGSSQSASSAGGPR
jgi:hypothetical protein